MTIIRPTTINARFSQPVGLGGEKLWLCPTLGGDRLDLSGNGNHGTYQGGMGTVADKYKGGSRAYSFNGVNNYISGMAPASFFNYVNQTLEFSFSLWGKTLQTSSSNSGFFGSDIATSRTGFGLLDARNLSFSHGTRFDLTKGSAGNYQTQISDSSVLNNDWHHFAVTGDGSSVTIYKNGSPVASQSSVSTITNAQDKPMIIGGFYGSGTVYPTFYGYIDDFRAFDRALTQSEVKHLASRRGVLGNPRHPYDPLKRTVVRVPAAIPAATVVGSIKKPTTIIKPSYQSGYARNASESENPKLWDGLVGAWMPSLGVTGETLRDVSGNGNHGVLTIMDAASDWVATSKGLALDFDGFDDYVDCGRPSMGVGKLTVNAWIKLNAGNIFQHLVDSSSNSWHLALLNNNKPYFYNGATLHTLTETLSTNTWYMITGVQGSTLDLYINGVLSQSVSSNVNVTTNNIHIGRWQNGGRNFNGKISNTSIYNRALSPTEIKQLYVDSLAPFRKKQRVSVAVPAGIQFKPYWAKQSTQISGLLK